MKNSGKGYLFTLMIFSAAFSGIAQDIHFSQFYFAPLILNPALAGAERPSEAMLNYRSQWRSVTVPYSTYSISAHTRFAEKRSGGNFFGAGISVFQDQAGDGRLRTTQVSGIIAYHIQISKFHKLGLGFRGELGQRSIKADDFQWGSQYMPGSGYNPSVDPGEEISSASFLYPDISSGIVWSYDNTSRRVNVETNNFNRGSLGFSVSHLNRPFNSFLTSGERLQVKYTFHGRFLFSIPSTRIAVNPGFVYYRQAPNTEILLGGMLRYNLLPESKYTSFYKGLGAYLGAYVRTKDAVIVTSMIEMDNLKIGFSYDANISNLRQSSDGRGGFEIAISYTGSGAFFSKSRRRI
jgi:type IX secretion system PorP/SprF family membrane protein